MTDAQTPCQKHFHDALHDFLCMARHRSQAMVLQLFLEHVVRRSDLCNGGTLLVHVPGNGAEIEGNQIDGHLKVWNLTSDESEIHSLASWDALKVDLPRDEGISTLAFRKRSEEYAPIASEHPNYWWPPKSTTEDCYREGPCFSVPILLPNRRELEEPFGVVTFQNRASHAMEVADFNNMKLAVKALESMMSLSPIKLVDKSTVFIVHGRDEEFRKELEAILEAEKLLPVVIQSMARTGSDLLGFLEEKIHNCLAGFILLTPDDEGRLYKFGEVLRQRPRQNVIFEAGYLTALFRDTNRLCFLQKGDMEIPSDLHGLLMETTKNGRIDPERIRRTLRNWGLVD